MIKEGKFGTQEAICIITITTVSKVFYTSPTMVMKIVGTAGWYMTLFSAATATVAFTVVYLLLKRFPGKNIMEIYDIVLGKSIGSFFSLSLLLIVLLTAAANIREFTEVMIVYVFPLSPPSYIIGLLLIIIVLAAYLGLEPIARVSRLFGGMLLFGLLSILILATRNYELYHLFPILGYGIGTTFSNGALRSSAYGEVTIVAVIAGSLQGISHVKKAGYISLFLSGAIISLVIFSFTLSFPYYTGREITAPMYLMTTLINYAGFFQRLEAIFLYIWSISMAISSSALIYIVLMIYGHIFNIQDKKPLILPLNIILYCLAMLPESMGALITIYMQALRTYGWIFFFLPPALALLIAMAKGEEGEVKNAKEN